MTRRAVAALVALLVLGGTALAEDRQVRVELAGGNVVEGTLVGVKDRVITVRKGATELSFREDEVQVLVLVPSQAEAPEKPIDVAVEDAALPDVIAAISSRAGRPIFVDSALAAEKVTITLRQIPWRDAASVIAKLCRAELEGFGEGSLLVRAERRATVQLANTPVREVLAAIGRSAGKNVIAAPDLLDPITVSLDMSWERAVESVVRGCRLESARLDDTVLVTRERVALGGDTGKAANGRWGDVVERASKPIDLAVADADLADLCEEIGRLSGKKLQVERGLAKMSLRVNRAPWRDVVAFVARDAGLRIEERAGAIVLAARPRNAIRLRSCSAAPILRLLADRAGKTIAIASEVTGPVADLDLHAVEWANAIRIVAAVNGFTVREGADGALSVGADAKARPRALAALPEGAKAPTVSFARAGRSVAVPVRAILVGAPSSKVLVGDELLEEGALYQGVKVAKIDDGRIELALGEDRASILLEPTATKVEESDPPPGRDALGDPLPRRAVARLGTIRWRAAARCMAFTPDGKSLVAGCEDGTVRFFEFPSGKLQGRLAADTAGVTCIAVSPDGRTIASGGFGKTIRLWEASSGKALASLEGSDDGSVLTLAFSPDGKTIAAAGHRGEVESLAFSPDGKTIASGSADTTVRLWNVANRAVLATLEGHADRVTSVAFAPDGKTVASGSWDKTVRLWSVPGGALAKKIEVGASGIDGVAFSPDGKTLAVADGISVGLRDAASGAELVRLATISTSSIAFAPDGKALAWSALGAIRLCEVPGGRPLGARDGHVTGVTGVAFAPDGRTLVSASHDEKNAVRVWDLASAKPPLELDGSWVNAVAFAPDGKTLASGGHGVQLWQVPGGTPGP